MAFLPLRVDRLWYQLSSGVPIVSADGNVTVDRVVGAHVIESRQSGLSVGGASGVAERPRLEGSPAGVPEIVAVGQAERVDVGADGDLLRWTQLQFAEHVAIVHHVEERKARINSGRRQHLKERAVGRVARILVA